jgi:molybdenum cofactor biosynthesis protein B
MVNAPARGPRVITVTVSDTKKRANDVVGVAIDEELKQAGFHVLRHVVIREEPDFIREFVRSAANNNETDAIIMSGGTGINPRDQTFEALESIFEKRIEGFGEAFRRLAFEEAGPNAMLARVTAGVFNECVVYSLPGGRHGALLGLRTLILPTLRHTVDLAVGRETHTPGGSPDSHRSRPSSF